MPGGERVVLADEGEGESEESDPILVTEEANVGGNAGVSTGPSTLSTATAAPRSSGTIGSTPTAPQPSTSKPRKPRWDTVGTVFRELAGIDVATKNPTLDDVKGAAALMQQACARDTHARARYAARLSAFELYIKHSEQAQAGQAFAREHLPPPQPSLKSSPTGRCFVRVRRPRTTPSPSSQVCLNLTTTSGRMTEPSAR